MAEMEWDPETYLATMLDEIPGYVELQKRVADATLGLNVQSVLELGTGTGETAVRILTLHPHARWTGIDASEPMLARARERLPDAELRTSRLEDPLPAGRFDLVVSVLAVHHLNAEGKRNLFRRIATLLASGGRFVLGDVVVPEREEDVRIEIDWVVDLPDRVDDQVSWLGDAGFKARATWQDRDLAVLVAEKR